MTNHINGIFKACTPTEEQKTKMLNKILDKRDVNTHVIIKETPCINTWKRVTIPALTCILCILIGIGVFEFLGIRNSFTVYAYGTDIEISNAGVELSAGEISNDGIMKGQLLRFYIKGKNINSIRYTCKNQYIDFTDWTEKRQNFSMQKQFTVLYGEKSSDYYYLVVNWNPKDTIHELTDIGNKTIVDLNNELKNDTIVMEITFLDGSKLTKKIDIMLQNNGKILAKLQDYLIKQSDEFIFNPQKSLPLSKTNNNVQEPTATIKTDKYSLTEIEAAKEIAKKYYSGFSGEKEIVVIEYIENVDLSNSVSDKYKNWQTITFKAFEKSMYPEIYRTIILARENSQKDWVVINEGY